jgi:3'(2'), 5'-bisphosphate nucleotidase
MTTTTKDQISDAELLAAITDIAVRAGEVIMEIYRRDFEIREKSDASPVTEADEAAERLIAAELRRMTPDIPVIAEEEVAAGRNERPGERFWLVDPLDGTKEFISRNGEFTVNIALIEGEAPVLGVVYAPALGTIYAGAEPGTATMARDGGAAQPISARNVPADGAVIVSSRSHGDADRLSQFTGDMKVADMRPAGSSLKFCLVAAGEADIYPRLGPTCEWDTAAGHAVLRAAGGSVRRTDGSPFVYGKSGWRNPEFVARGLE